MFRIIEKWRVSVIPNERTQIYRIGAHSCVRVQTYQYRFIRFCKFYVNVTRARIQSLYEFFSQLNSSEMLGFSRRPIRGNKNIPIPKYSTLKNLYELFTGGMLRQWSSGRSNTPNPKGDMASQKYDKSSDFYIITFAPYASHFRS